MLIREALDHARARLRHADIPDADFESELLLRIALAPHDDAGPAPNESVLSRAAFFGRLTESLDPAAIARYDALLARRIAREPTAYIRGHREFYGLDLIVTPDVLVPRPETEMLVEAARTFFAHRAANPPPSNLHPSPSRSTERGTEGERFPPSPQQAETRTESERFSLSPNQAEEERRLESPLIADIGTGSGAIAVAIAVALPNARLYATDISSAALDVARRNAARHNIETRITFLPGDLLLPLTKPVDFMTANLPYVTSGLIATLSPEVQAEPRLALDGGTDGLDLIRRLLDQAPSRLRPAGAIALEFGEAQESAIDAIARAAFPTANIKIERDLAGHPRMLFINTE